MTTAQILSSRQTKTAKMIALFELGHTRSQVAQLLGCGYGFVQNVYAATYPERINSRSNRSQRRANNAAQRRASVNPASCTAAPRFTRSPFDRKFGVEIEFFADKSEIDILRRIRSKGIDVESERYNHTTRLHWKLTTDSSVSPGAHRRNFIGRELVSPILEGAAGLQELRKVCEALKSLGARINKTCGLHIHFDARSWSMETWRRLFLNYAAAERAIDSLMPPSRRGDDNTYCQTTRGRSRNRMQQIQAATTPAAIQVAATGREGRYSKVNAKSFARQGSVEFRQHSGTIDFAKISAWVELLHGICLLSENSSEVLRMNVSLELLADLVSTETFEFLMQRRAALA